MIPFYTKKPQVNFRFFDKYKLIAPDFAAGWTTGSSGSGGSIVTPITVLVSTGTTPNSRGLRYFAIHGFNSGNMASDRVDFTKKIEITFFIRRSNSDSEAIARFQLKHANTEGQLANVVVHYPNSRVEFWINGILKGTLAGNAVPVNVDAMAYSVLSIINGTTGGVDAIAYLGNLWIIQEW